MLTEEEIREGEFPQEDLHSALIDAVHDNRQLVENLERVRAQYLALEYEDSGWKRIAGGNGFQENQGLGLQDLKMISKLLREEIAGSALPKRANEARYSYTFGKPFYIDGLEENTVGKGRRRGPKTKLVNFVNSDTAQRYIFSEEAQEAMHAASSTDSCYLLLGHDESKEVHAIPLSEIADVMTHSDYDDEVWAYLRKWDRVTLNEKGENDTETHSRWYFTDRYTGTRPEKIGEDKVDPDHTIIDASFNRQVGWTLGVPDLMAGQIWNKKYLTMIAYGEQVTEALAFFAAKVKVNSSNGSSAVGLKISQARGQAGNTLSYGAGNEIDVFSSAGKTYDFGGLKVFAGFYAASVGIPLTDLTADPSAAGASYGSAASLLPGARRLIEARRNYWASWMRRVLKWATGEDVTVSPASIMEEDEYRSVQKVSIAYNTGLFHEDETRQALSKVAGIALLHNEAPEGAMLPNNENSWQRSDVDPADGPPGSVSSAPPDQGKNNGTGGQDDSAKKDMRDDKIGESLTEMQRDERMDRLEALLEQITHRLG